MGSDELFQRQMDVLEDGFLGLPEVQFLLDAVSQAVLIVNSQRQVVYANEPAAALLGARDGGSALQHKPGELLRCAREASSDGGCGTSYGCRFCGIGQAVIEAGVSGTSSETECRIQTVDGSGLVLGIRARTLIIQGQQFFVLSVTDLGPLKHRDALEHTFFHDVLNTASTLLINGEYLLGEAHGELKSRTARIVAVTRRLIDEIRGQRILLQAERGEFSSRQEQIQVAELLESIALEYGDANARRQVLVSVDPGSHDFTMETDTVLLTRVLCNLVKNACEACKAGDHVVICASRAEPDVLFEVRNPGFIPLEIQTQLFTRSFSTKGTGRGLGTYGSRLFTERYLGGSIGFQSSRECGTVFWIRLPDRTGAST